MLSDPYGAWDETITMKDKVKKKHIYTNHKAFKMKCNAKLNGLKKVHLNYLIYSSEVY